MSKAATKENAWTKPLKQKQNPPPGLEMPTPAVDELALRERFLHVMVSLVGLKVTISLKTGEGVQLEGILHTATPFPSMVDDLRCKYLLKAAVVVSGTPEKPFEPNSTVLIKMEDVVDVYCKSITLAQNGSSFTDTEISAGGSKARQGFHQAGSAWTAAPPARASPPSGGDMKGSIGGWDQFKANEDLFNVKASYDENLYTTELDKSTINQSDIRKAEKLAKEIEKTASSNMHIAEERNQVVEGDYDEEDRYSGVLKSSGAAKAPAKKPTMNYAAAASKKSESAVAPPGFKGETRKEEAQKQPATKEEKPKPAEAKKSDEGKTPKDEKQQEASEKKEPEKDATEKPKSKLSASAKEFSFNVNAKSFTPGQQTQPPPMVHAPMPMQPHPSQFMAPHPMQPGMYDKQRTPRRREIEYLTLRFFRNDAHDESSLSEICLPRYGRRSYASKRSWSPHVKSRKRRSPS